MFGCCKFKKLLKRISHIEDILLEQSDSLLRIEKLLTPEPAATIEFYINNSNTKVVSMFLKVSQSLPLSIKIKDKFGNDAKVDGVPAWAVTDAALGALVVAADGMSAMFSPIGPVGMLKIQVKCDADLGEGVKEILGELDMELLAGDAEVVEISAGEAI